MCDNHFTPYFSLSGRARRQKVAPEAKPREASPLGSYFLIKAEGTASKTRWKDGPWGAGEYCMGFAKETCWNYYPFHTVGSIACSTTRRWTVADTDRAADSGGWCFESTKPWKHLQPQQWTLVSFTGSWLRLYKPASKISLYPQRWITT